MTAHAEPINVLHVDDEAGFAEVTAELLERRDERFSVTTASSAAECLERLAGGDVDCVVSDYEMPDVDGIELLERVRDDHPDLPFVLYTGKGSEEIASDAISAGVTDYLQKASGRDQYDVLANRVANAVEGRRSAREAERRRHRLEQMLKTVPACVVQIDADGQFVFANERATEVLGLDRSEVPERTYNDPKWRITDLDGNPIPDSQLPFRQVRDTGEPVYGRRHTIEWPDGTRKVLSVNGAPLFDEEGNVESTVFALTDVTERLARERELEALRDQFRLVEQYAGVGYWELDRGDGASPHLVVSEGGRASLDVEPDEELTLDDLLALVHPEDRDPFEDAIERAADAGESFDVEVRTRAGEGDRRWVNVVGEPVGDGHRVQGVMWDVTERKRQERRLEAVTETTSKEAIYLKDAEGRYRYINEAGARVFNRAPEEVVGRRAGTLYDSEEDGPLAVDERVIETEEPAEYEVSRTVDGETHYFLAEKYPYYEDGQLFGLVGISRDITDRKRNEIQIERQNERLNEFASVVSHDLRNPLSVARGRLQLAREECDSEHLDEVAEAHDRMETLVDDVLSLARAGRAVGETEPVALSDVVEESWQNVETDTATLDHDVDARIQADETRLQQLLENLFRNAVEHGGPGVTVTVGTLPGGFYVEDDGPGIPEAEREHVFDYGHSTTDSGTGVGLSIVRDVAEAHGWDVAVTAAPDGGARFECTGVRSG